MDAGEAGSGSTPFDSGGDEEAETSGRLGAPLKLLQTRPKCELYPDLRRIIQVRCSGKVAPGGIGSPEEKIQPPRVFYFQEKFTEVFSQYFQPVPSNPFYYFYCPQTSKKDVRTRLLTSAGGAGILGR